MSIHSFRDVLQLGGGNRAWDTVYLEQAVQALRTIRGRQLAGARQTDWAI